MTTLLAVEHLHKSFGGLTATDDVSLTVARGEKVSIIGPNGAGKTTLFNQISGYITPDSGNITFSGRTINGMSPHTIVKLGIGRAFQRANIFPRLTTFENVQSAVISRNGAQFNLWRGRAKQQAILDRAQKILSIIGLDDHQQDRQANQLALGDQKRLEIGLALAMNPILLLLDEPTAGMSQSETENTVQLVKEVTEQFGMSLLFTEHDMDVVFDISERIYVLNQGAIIAEGTPQAIADDPKVQEVYLGNDALGDFS
ncbi:MAG: ABC transporter ATP-binding protein [Chloroflexota bacterium]